jgi:hypothetical protein
MNFRHAALVGGTSALIGIASWIGTKPSSAPGRTSADAHGPECNPAAKEGAGCCSADGEWRCKEAIPEGAKP